jgi:hypothetical protein
MKEAENPFLEDPSEDLTHPEDQIDDMEEVEHEIVQDEQGDIEIFDEDVEVFDEDIVVNDDQHLAPEEEEEEIEQNGMLTKEVLEILSEDEENDITEVIILTFMLKNRCNKVYFY